MFRFIFLSIFFSIYLSNSTLESLSFKYSLNDNFEKIPSYSIGLSLSNESSFIYNFNWSPSNNLILSSSFIENSSNDNSDNALYYNVGINVITKNMISYGIKINTLKFHKVFNTIKWNKYFINKKIQFNQFIDFYLGLSFSYSNQISYSSLNFMIDKKITENFYIMFGLKNLLLENKFNYNLGLQFTL